MKQMWSDYQLKSFEHYVKTCPKSLLGVYPLTPEGAYDAIGGAAAHGFGQRTRRIPGDAFKRFGVFAYDAANEGEDPNMSKYGKSLVALEKYLRQILSTEQMQEVSPLIESVCHTCKVAAMNGEDDTDLDNEAMDRPRRARDDPEPFEGSPRTGADPAFNSLVRNNKGSAMDARRGPTRSDVKSFEALFGPGSSTVRHV
jgi:hypothetical protein